MEELTELEKFGISVAINFRITFLQELLTKSQAHNVSGDSSALHDVQDAFKELHQRRIDVLRSAARKLDISL